MKERKIVTVFEILNLKTKWKIAVNVNYKFSFSYVNFQSLLEEWQLKQHRLLSCRSNNNRGTCFLFWKTKSCSIYFEEKPGNTS